MDKLAIIINQKAHNAALLDNYLQTFTGAGLEYQLFETEPEQLESIIGACAKDFKVILIGGGDGSIRSAAQHLVNSTIILGVIPLGTMNHFVKESGLPATPEELAEAILHRHTITIDTASVNETIFINNSSLGFYPKFAKKRDYYATFYYKWLSYIISLFNTLKRHPSFALTVTGNDIFLSLKTSFIMVSNNLYNYGFPLTIERESFTQGQLGIYYFRRGKLRLLKMLQGLLFGKRNFSSKKTSYPFTIAVRNCTEITISVDGDTLVTANPLQYKSLPKSLTLLTKKP